MWQILRDEGSILFTILILKLHVHMQSYFCLLIYKIQWDDTFMHNVRMEEIGRKGKRDMKKMCFSLFE